MFQKGPIIDRVEAGGERLHQDNVRRGESVRLPKTAEWIASSRIRWFSWKTVCLEANVAKAPAKRAIRPNTIFHGISSMEKREKNQYERSKPIARTAKMPRSRVAMEATPGAAAGSVLRVIRPPAGFPSFGSHGRLDPALLLACRWCGWFCMLGLDFENATKKPELRMR